MARIKIIWLTVLFLLAAFCEGDAFPEGNSIDDYYASEVIPSENTTIDYANFTTEAVPSENTTVDYTNFTTEYPPAENTTTDVNITTIYTTEVIPSENTTIDYANFTTEAVPSENTTVDYTNFTTEYPPAENATTDVNITTLYTTEYPPVENVTTDINITTIYTPHADNVSMRVNVAITPDASFEMAPPVQIGELVSLSGIVIHDRFDSPINAYLRIPYAQPPVGELRFKDPVFTEDFDKRDDPRVDMPPCVQYSDDLQIIGEEDCLYLNVYVPARTESVLKPVMVFLHGDTFEQGSGRLDQFDPRFLLTEDVILVTMNFRLGIFGFFHLEDEELGTPGNAALKDQQLALAWVNKHISNFGGDKNNICIFGQGAGAASVHLHILSPRSEGLFHKAIIQSGTAISPWVLGTENNGNKLADELELTAENYEDLLSTLRTKEAADILTAARNVANELRVPESPWSPFTGPIIERHGDAELAFLADDPFNIIESGKYNAVPILIGFTNAEGLGIEKILRVNHGWEGVIEDFFNLIPTELGLQRGSNDAIDLARRIEEFYFVDDQSDEGGIGPLVSLFGDIFFAFPAFRAALEHSRTSTEPVYFYKFSAVTALNVFRRTEADTAEIGGASHGDDLGYLFYIDGSTPSTLGNDEEIALENVIGTWTSFARTGSPSQEPENQPEDQLPEEPENQPEDQLPEEPENQPEDQLPEEPENQPEDQLPEEPENQPEDQLPEEPENQPEDQLPEEPENQPEDQLPGEPENQPEDQLPGEPEDQLPGEPENQPEDQLPGEPENQPEDQLPGEPENQPEDQLPGEPENQPEDQLPGEPENQPEDQLPGEPENQPEDQLPGEPENQPEDQLPGVPENQPEDQLPGEPENQPEDQLPGVPENQPEDQLPGEPENQPEDQLPGEPENQPEDQLPGEPENQPEDQLPGEPENQAEDQLPGEPENQPEDQLPGEPENQPEDQLPGEPENQLPGEPENQPDQLPGEPENQPEDQLPGEPENQPEDQLPGEPENQPEGQLPGEPGTAENGQNVEADQPIQLNEPEEDVDGPKYTKQWMPFTEEYQHYANIQTITILPDSNPSSKSMAFWIEVYKEFLGDPGGGASIRDVSIVMALCIAAVQIFINY